MDRTVTGSVARPGVLVLRHAVENASSAPVTDDDIAAILRGHGGRASHVRAIFEDASLATIAAAARSNGIGLPTVLAAYVRAKLDHAAANPELDEALRDREALGLP